MSSEGVAWRRSIAAGFDGLARVARDSGEYRRATELRENARRLRATNELERGQAAVRRGLQLTREAWERLKRGVGGQTEINIGRNQ